MYHLNAGLAGRGHLPSISPLINSDAIDHLVGNLDQNMRINNNDHFPNTYVNHVDQQTPPQPNYLQNFQNFQNYYNTMVDYNNISSQQFVTYGKSHIKTK